MAKTISKNMSSEQITKTLRPFGPGKSGFQRGARNDALSAKTMNSAATMMSPTSWLVGNSPASSMPRVYAFAASNSSSLLRRSRRSHQMSPAMSRIGPRTMIT